MRQEDRCLEAETVRLLIAEQLPPRELARAARHLGACSRCRDSVVLAAGGGSGAAEAPDPARGARELSKRVPGEVVGRKYRLTSVLGRGRYSSVWKAERLDWRAPVALKLLIPSLAEAKEFTARFEREVRLAAALRSPNVVQILDHGIDESTRQAYIALELLEGETLDERLRREGPLAPAVAVGLLEQVVRAVERAHSLGIVHRDLKPANIFILRDFDRELVKVLDFGVAKSRSGQGILTMVTSPGTVLGTPFYMSPEQIRASTDVDHHADLWALAVIACECLTGRKPFLGKDFFEVAFAVVDETKRPVPSKLGPSPSGFDVWFARATHPDRARRFPTARRALDALVPICERQGSRSGRPRPSRGRSGEASGETEAVARFSKYALFLAALGVSAVLWYRIVRRTPEQAQRTTAATLSATPTRVPGAPQTPVAAPLPAEARGAAPGGDPRVMPVPPAAGSSRGGPAAAPPATPVARPAEHAAPQRPVSGAPRPPPARPRSANAQGATAESGSPSDQGPARQERPVRIDLAE